MVKNDISINDRRHDTYWEDVATTRWGKYITNIERRTILRAHELSREPTTAVELGCEGGRWLKMLTELGWQVTGTDINKEVLELCKQSIPTATIILVEPDENRIPCETKSIDLLLVVEVAPVIQSAWFIDEAYRVLRDGGLIVGTFWNMTSFRGLYCRLRTLFKRDFNWYNRTYETWKRIEISGKFVIDYDEGFCWFPFSRDSDSKFVPFFGSIRVSPSYSRRFINELTSWRWVKTGNLQIYVPTNCSS